MCGKEMTVYVDFGFRMGPLKVKCGQTSPSGAPFLCDECKEKYKHTNWRQRAAEYGETFDEEDM